VLFFDLLISQVLTPLLSLTIVPGTLFDFKFVFILLVRYYVVSTTMLFTLLPLSVVSSSIGPKINSDSTFLIVDVLTHEHTAISPLIGTFSMHHIILPISKVESVIIPHKETPPIKHVILPFSDIPVSIWPAVLTLTFLGCVLIETHILRPIVPFFFSESVLLILVPVPYVF
jgi:hypothetical protein